MDILILIDSETVAIGQPFVRLKAGETESEIVGRGAGIGKIRIVAAAPLSDADELGFWLGPPLQVEEQQPAPDDQSESARQLIESCRQIRPITLMVTLQTFQAGSAVYSEARGEDHRCLMHLVVAARPDGTPPMSPGGSCSVTVRFRPFGFPYLLPTTQRGECDALVAIAQWLPDGSDEAEDHLQRLRNAWLSLSVDEWDDIKKTEVCLRETCYFLP